MWRNFSLVALSALGIALLVGDAALAQRGRDRDKDRGDWELLGSQTVGFGVDRDVIRVGRGEGRFSSIALEVKDNDVYILDLKVVFLNNQVQDIRVRSRVRKNSRTRPLDLAGGDRGIKQIELTYRSRPNFRGRAVVSVFGQQDRRSGRPGPGPGADRWDALGCQKVGFLVDRDVIRVGRQDGRFRALRLRALGNSIHVMDLKVVYANGQPDDLQVRQEIRPGRETKPIDLRGERRSIRQIEMVYRSRPSFKGQATVCVDGLH